MTATVTVAECQPAAPGPGARQAPPLASGGMRDPETASKARFPDCASAPWFTVRPSAALSKRAGRRPGPVSQWGAGPGTVAAVGLGQAGGPGRAMPGRARATVTAGQGRSLMGAPASEHPMPRARGRWLNTHRIQVTQGTRESAGCVLSLSFQMSLQRSSSPARRPGGGKATGVVSLHRKTGPIQYGCHTGTLLMSRDSFELNLQYNLS